MSHKEFTPYITQCMFNITRIIKEHHEKDIILSKDFIDNIDFLEVSKKSIKYEYEPNRFMDDKKEESLAINIISTLPLDYYKNLITFNWIYAGKDHDYTLVSSALGHKAYDFIKQLLLIGENHLEDKTKHREYSGTGADDYERYVLQPILNIGHHLLYLDRGVTKKIKNEVSYDEVFNLALKQYEFVYNKKQKIYNTGRTFNTKHWFKEYETLSGNFFHFEKREELVRLLLTQSSSFDFFKDAYSQYGKKNPFLHNKSIEVAFKAGNIDVVNYLDEKLTLERPDYISLVKKTIKEWTLRQQHKFDSSYSSSGLDINEEYISNILQLTEKYTDVKNLSAKEVIGLFIQNNIANTQKLVELFPQVKTEKIIDNLNLNEVLYAQKLFSKFMKENKFEYKDSKSHTKILHPSFNLYLSYSLKKTFDKISLKNITTESKIIVKEFIASDFLPFIELKNNNYSLTKEELLNTFRTFLLDQDLSTKDNIVKKNKI